MIHLQVRFEDFNILYGYGAQAWAGQYAGDYPYPANLLFALLALLPVQLAFVVWAGGNLLAFVHTFKREALVWAAYCPVWICFGTGQIDLIGLWLYRLSTPLSLALLTLKPQLFAFALPALFKPGLIKPFIRWVCIIYGAALLVRPTWPVEWAAKLTNGHAGDGISLIGRPVVALSVLLCCVLLGRVSWADVWVALNPNALHIYSLAMLAGGPLLLIPLSFALFFIVREFGPASQWLYVLIVLGNIKGGIDVKVGLDRCRNFYGCVSALAAHWKFSTARDWRVGVHFINGWSGLLGRVYRWQARAAAF